MVKMNKQLQKSDIGVDFLIKEIISGEYPRDILPNSALGFTNEQQAQYFSNLRKNLQSDMAYAVMTNSQSLYDLELLKEIKR